MNLSELFIRRKIKDGDIREFEKLFVHYYEPLCRYANQIVKDMDAAEDLVQEFFYQLWKNRETLDVKVSLNAYLYQSVRNNALRYLEHQAVRRSYAERFAGGSAIREPATWQDEAEWNDLGKMVTETLQRLPDRCARIFRMNRFDGKKYREIAEALSISVKTVEADMGKALKMFRITLKEYTGKEINPDEVKRTGNIAG